MHTLTYDDMGLNSLACWFATGQGYYRVRMTDHVFFGPHTRHAVVDDFGNLVEVPV